MAKGALRKVQRLRQVDEAWEMSVRRMRTWITPKKQAPYRPYIVMMASQAGKVIGSAVFEKAPTHDQVLDALANAMLRPALGSGGKRRPGIIYGDDKALAEALAPQLQEVGIRCEYRHTLREIEEALLHMEHFMNKQEPVPGLLKSPGVTPYMANGLFEAAAFFYREAPWRWVDDSRPIEVHYPPDGKPRYAVVMGHGGQTYGLAVYQSPDELRQVYAGTPSEKLLGKMEWTSLLFCEMIETPFEDLDDMEKYGWPVAGEQAYPVPIRIPRSGNPTRPGKSEILWFEAALLAIPAFVRDSLQTEKGFLRPAEGTLTVKMADGEDRVYLRYPVPGFEVESEEDWAEIEEEEDAQAETAHERNVVLLQAFEQWLARQGLSKKTIKEHLFNAEFFAQDYMADEGGGVQLPRSADEADTLDVDEFLSDWFLEVASWSSVRAVEANIASLKKFYTCLKETGQMPADSADEVLALLQTERGYFIETAQQYEEEPEFID